MSIDFQGVFSVVPTPFTPGDEVDTTGIGSIIDAFVGAGVSGFTTLGVTSEVTRLSDQERDAVLDTVVNRVDGRVPIVAGTTAEGLASCIRYSKRAKEAGAQAVMISPPRMAKLNSEAVVRHYKEVASAVDIPIVLQDFPPASGFTMEASLLVRIAKEVPHVQCIKLEDAPTPSKVTKIRVTGDGHPISILGGLGGVYLLEELIAGADGAMTGFAYPEVLIQVVTAFRSGGVKEAAESFYSFVPLMRFEFQEGIGMAIRKDMLRRRGLIKNPAVRPPAPGMDAPTSTMLDTLLSYYKDKGIPWI